MQKKKKKTDVFIFSVEDPPSSFRTVMLPFLKMHAALATLRQTIRIMCQNTRTFFHTIELFCFKTQMAGLSKADREPPYT